MFDENVNERALDISPGHFGKGFTIQYSIILENNIIPIVDPADSAKETDTDVSGFMQINITIHIPKAFSGAGLRLEKKENKAM